MLSVDKATEHIHSPVLDDNTGERMVPESADRSTFWEHAYRYAFATRFVAGKSVLDIACGEGYGTAALQKAGALHVIGVDVSESACEHARAKYGVDARTSDGEKIPLPAESVDVITSFETIEHVRNPERFLEECQRVLVPGGQVIISTPNKGVYTWLNDLQNPHHLCEMTEQEFSSALRARFRHCELYSQRLYCAPWWSLRAFVSERSVWTKVRGFRRLRLTVQELLTKEAVKEPSPKERSSIVDLILSITREPHEFLNPYAIRPRGKSISEKATYIVARAIK